MKQIIRSLTALGSALMSALCPRNTLALGNAVAPMSPHGTRTYIADAAIPAYTMVKLGSDENHVVTCGDGEAPIGMTLDDAASAQYADVTVMLLGAQAGSKITTASGAIAAGDELVTAAAGALKTLPAGAATYYVAGRALNTVADGGTVQFVPKVAEKRIVV